MADYEDPPTFGVATVTVPQLNRLSENIRYLKEQQDAAAAAGIRQVKAQVSAAGVANVGSGLTDLMSYALPAGTLATDGDTLEISALGSITGGGSKVVKLVFGTSSQDLWGTTLETFWNAEIRIVRVSAAFQYLTFQAFYNQPAGFATWSATENLASGLTLKFQGQATASDQVKQFTMLARYLPAPA